MKKLVADLDKIKSNNNDVENSLKELSKAINSFGSLDVTVNGLDGDNTVTEKLQKYKNEIYGNVQRYLKEMEKYSTSVSECVSEYTSNESNLNINTSNLLELARNNQDVSKGYSGTGSTKLSDKIYTDFSYIYKYKIYNNGMKMCRPLGDAHFDVTDWFGQRDQPCAGASTNHRGIDMGAPEGTRCVAAVKGKVITAQTVDNGGYGKYVQIQDEETGLIVTYGHLSQVNVTEGQQVDFCDDIGAVGTTGTSTGNHLHFQVEDANGNAIDPTNFIELRNYDY